MPLVIGSAGQISPQDEVTLASRLVTITTQGQARGGGRAIQEAGLARSGPYAETRAYWGPAGFRRPLVFRKKSRNAFIFNCL